MAKHINSGDCESCDLLFDKYPGFHEGLRSWFKSFQAKTRDAHISCAGRGEKDQEEFFLKGTSKAHYGKSAHNYNLAIDIFRLTQDSQLSYDKNWFRDKVGTEVIKANTNPSRTFDLNWYGAPGSKFLELPHVQISNWEYLVKEGLVKLVEPEATKSSSPDSQSEPHSPAPANPLPTLSAIAGGQGEGEGSNSESA